jgi:hypothetical protein
LPEGAGDLPWSWRGIQCGWRLRHCCRGRSAVSSMPGRVADRRPSLRALLDDAAIGPMAAACEGLPIPTCLGVGSTSGPALVAFASPSKMRSCSRGPVPCLRVSRRALRRALARSGPAWDSSLGVVKRSPLHRHQRLVSTPGLLASPRGVAPKSCPLARSRSARPRGAARPGTRPRPSARRCHFPDSFRPCRSSRLRRFAPPCTLQVCCTLLPIMGFATFPVRRLLLLGCLSAVEHPAGSLTLRCAGPACLRPARAVPPESHRPAGAWARVAGGGGLSRWRKTLRSFSLASSRSVSPRPLPSRRCAPSRLASGSLPVRGASFGRPGGRPRPQGVAPLTNPLRRCGVATAQAPDAPLGFPMRGFLSAAADRSACASHVETRERLPAVRAARSSAGRSRPCTAETARDF